MKVKALIVVPVVMVVAGGGWWFWRQSRPVAPERAVSPLVNEEQEAAILTWRDPAGFSFDYLEGLTLDTHPADQVNYANLDIAQKDTDGKIRILVQASPYPDVNAWENEADKEVSVQIVDTTLSDKLAKKILLPGGGVEIVALDAGALYSIELTPDRNGFWQRQFDRLVRTFTYVYPEGYGSSDSGAAGSSPNTGGIIEETEEIIE